MKARLARLRRADREAGLTLIELLVAASMSVILVGAACAMLISAVHDQPNLSKKDQNITTARYVLERMTREIRNGLVVYSASDSKVSFETQVRHKECGGATTVGASEPSKSCRVTYNCTTTACTRTETNPEVETGGASETIVSGLDNSKNSSVFNWSCDPQDPCEEPGEISYLGVTLRIENPEDKGDLKISDGAGLRTVEYESQ